MRYIYIDIDMYLDVIGFYASTNQFFCLVLDCKFCYRFLRVNENQFFYLVLDCKFFFEMRYIYIDIDMYLDAQSHLYTYIIYLCIYVHMINTFFYFFSPLMMMMMNV